MHPSRKSPVIQQLLLLVTPFSCWGGFLRVKLIFAATFADYFSKRRALLKIAVQSMEAEEFISLQLLKLNTTNITSKALKEQIKLSV